MAFEEDETRIEVAPLLDVAFIALAVLALAAARGPDLTMLPAGLPVLGVTTDRPAGDRIVVSFDADGTFRVNGESVSTEGLTARVAELRESTPEAIVYLAAEPSPSEQILAVTSHDFVSRVSICSIKSRQLSIFLAKNSPNITGAIRESEFSFP